MSRRALATAASALTSSIVIVAVILALRQWNAKSKGYDRTYACQMMNG